jgi:hypothetical protein
MTAIVTEAARPEKLVWQLKKERVVRPAEERAAGTA